MSESYQANLRARIRQLMADKGWEPKHLARKLGHKHAQQVNAWLREPPAKTRAIATHNVRKIADAFGVTLQALDPNGTESYDQADRPPHMRRGADRGVRLGAHDRSPLLQEGNVYPRDPLLSMLEAVWHDLAEDVRRELVAIAGKNAPTVAPMPRTIPKEQG